MTEKHQHVWSLVDTLEKGNVVYYFYRCVITGCTAVKKVKVKK